MNDPWYQPRFVTFIAAILLMASFVALNTWETDKGLYRVYLDEGEKLCVAYRGMARGWPETYMVRYVLDEEATTLLGYPKRKFIDDEYNSRPLWINIAIAACAFASLTLVVESLARLVAMRPKRVRQEMRRSRFASRVQNVAKETVAQEDAASETQTGAPPVTRTGRPITAKQGLKPAGRPLTSKLKSKPAGRPASTNQKPKIDEPRNRLSGVKPVLVARRQSSMKRLIKT